MDVITIYEIGSSADKFVPSGRKILMGADAPLFKHLGDKGEKALKSGSMAVSIQMFDQLTKMIEEANLEVRAKSG